MRQNVPINLCASTSFRIAGTCIHYILETHAHADHLSGAQVLKAKLPNAKIGIGAKITEVQKVLKRFLHLATRPHAQAMSSAIPSSLETPFSCRTTGQDDVTFLPGVPTTSIFRFRNFTNFQMRLESLSDMTICQTDDLSLSNQRLAMRSATTFKSQPKLRKASL